MGIPSQAKYGVFNDKGEQVYFAFEGRMIERVFILKHIYRIRRLSTYLLCNYSWICSSYYG